jgi:hypothetical protein
MKFITFSHVCQNKKNPLNFHQVVLLETLRDLLDMQTIQRLLITIVATYTHVIILLLKRFFIHAGHCTYTCFSSHLK